MYYCMQACGKGGRWERAVQMLQEMDEDGLPPETSAYRAVLQNLADAGQWEKVTTDH